MSKANDYGGNGSCLSNRNVEGPSVDPNSVAIVQLRTQEGLTQTELAERAGFSRATLIRMEHGERVKTAHVQAVALVLGVPCELLLASANGLASRSPEWDLAAAQQFTPLRTLPHGLAVRTAKVPSRTFPGGWGRLKIYDMQDFRWDQRDRARDVLGRHAEACRRVHSPHVIQNYVCELDSSGRHCITVDEWREARPLDDVFATERPPALGCVAHQLLLGLRAIHDQQLICRGLSPRTVHWDAVGHALITDLELSKLLDQARTVRPPAGFRSDRFLAPEVAAGGREIGPPADLYSWAQTIRWLAGDKEAVTRNGSGSAGSLGLPAPIARIVELCSAVAWTKRPANVDSILEPIAEWARSESTSSHERS